MSGKLLIIEDDAALGRAMQVRLDSVGYKTTLLTSSFPAALTLASSCDLVLLDVMLGTRSGFEICRELKSAESTRDVQVIMVTTLSDPQSKVLGFQGGADGYLVKPFAMQELIARVEAGLRIKRMTDELRATNMKLEELSLTDGLTDVLNRRGWDQQLKREFDSALRYGFPLSLLMIDINEFKQINDREGHPVGDEALRVIAQVCKKGLREPDSLGRYGGDEFSILLPQIDIDGALIAALRLEQEVRTIVLQGAEGTFSLSISIGGACHQQDKFGSPLELIQAADKALYRAKNGLRDGDGSPCVAMEGP